MALNNKLVGYWKLEEATGNRVDSKGANHLVPFVAEITNAAMKLGNGVYLTRAANSSCFISVSASGLTGIGSALTIAGWYIQAAYPTQRVSLIEIDGQWGFEQTATSGTLNLAWRSTSENISVNMTSGIGTLCHIAVTREAGGLVRIFENGIQKASGTASSAVLASTGTLDMGDVGFGIGTAAKPEMKLDEMGLWKRALTPNEIASLYNGGAGNFFDHNNAGAFDFDATSNYVNTQCGILVGSGSATGNVIQVRT